MRDITANTTIVQNTNQKQDYYAKRYTYLEFRNTCTYFSSRRICFENNNYSYAV